MSKANWIGIWCEEQWTTAVDIDNIRADKVRRVGFASTVVQSHLRKCESFYLITSSPERSEDNLPGPAESHFRSGEEALSHLDDLISFLSKAIGHAEKPLKERTRPKLTRKSPRRPRIRNSSMVMVNLAHVHPDAANRFNRITALGSNAYFQQKLRNQLPNIVPFGENEVNAVHLQHQRQQQQRPLMQYTVSIKPKLLLQLIFDTKSNNGNGSLPIYWACTISRLSITLLVLQPLLKCNNCKDRNFDKTECINHLELDSSGTIRHLHSYHSSSQKFSKLAVATAAAPSAKTASACIGPTSATSVVCFRRSATWNDADIFFRSTTTKCG